VDDTPKIIIEAFASPDMNNWKEAVRSEMDSIISNGTWELVDQPYGCKPMGSKWLFKKKLRLDGTIDKYKIRHVAKDESSTGGAANPLGWPAPQTLFGLPLGPHEQSGLAVQPIFPYYRRKARKVPRMKIEILIPDIAAAVSGRHRRHSRPPANQTTSTPLDLLAPSASSHHPYNDISGMRPALSPPPPHMSSSRPQRSSSMPAPPRAYDVGAHPDSNVNAQVM
jgi:hypothetical protein